MRDAKEDLVRLDGIWFSYRRRWVIQDVTLSARAGEITAIVGPNGAGKSTILKVASGFLKPGKGSSRVLDRDVGAMPARARGRLLTYMGAELEPVFGFTVEETVLLGRFPHTGALRKEGPDDVAAARRAMSVLDLDDLAERPVTDLSSGERQRVYLARALCQETSVLLLDEPTAHLDMAYEMRVMEVLSYTAQERNAAVVVILHDLNLASRFASSLYFVREGRIYKSGCPAETVTAQTIREVYGAESYVFPHPEGRWPQVVPLRPAQKYRSGDDGLYPSRCGGM